MTIRAAVLALAILAGPVAAAPQCGGRDFVVAQLAERYGETRRGLGVAANNTVMEIFASAASGSWTITVTTPDGQTCLVASGQSFEPTQDPLPPAGVPG